MEWINESVQNFADARNRDQVPHAVLVHGSAGTGRGALAAAIASGLLGLDAPEDTALPGALGDHPDFRFVEPLPDKKTIGVDQIRALIDFLALTSHQRGAKVAVISPAEALTHAAANALLKTLEEPPAHSILLLLADALSRLPPTVVSRCHRLRISKPGRDSALAWLRAQDDKLDWTDLLEQSGGAPLAALALREQAGDDALGALAADLAALRGNRATPAAVARKWQKLDPDICLTWLYRQVAFEIRQVLTGRSPDSSAKSRTGSLQNDSKMLNMDRSFDVLSELNELRRLAGGGVNVELNLMRLLSRWYGA